MNELRLKSNAAFGGVAMIPFFALAFSPAMLSSILGWRPLKVISVIRKAYSLWRAGYSVRVALSAATGGWGWLVSLLAQFGLAYLASQAFNGSWIVGY